MQHRNLGNTGFKISEVGLGCWQFGGDFGAIAKDTGMAILRRAAELGIDFLDTADVYGDGVSETWIGEFLKERGGPEKAGITVASKIGRSAVLYPDKYSLDVMRSVTEGSLKRLGVEALDLTQLHCVPIEVLRAGDIFDWLDTLVAEGKIKHYGASVESMEQAEVCLKHPNLKTLQIIFNIFRPKPIEALFEQAKAKNIGIIVRLPLASGLLSGKFTKQTTFEAQDHRNYNKDGERFSVSETFAGIPFEDAVGMADAIKADVPQGMTMAQMALRWILDHDAVSTIIPGATRVDQVESNAAASALPPLPEALHGKFRSYVAEHVEPHIRGPY